jgi:hypothetical protein
MPISEGRLYFVNEYTKPDSLKKAQHYFEESIQKDPDFALAYAGLADTYVYLAFAGALPRDQAYRFAKQLAKALELDDSIGEAYDTLGELSWDLTGIGTLPIGSSTVPSPWRRATVARMRTAPFFWPLLAGAPKLWPRSQRSTNWTTVSVRLIPNQPSVLPAARLPSPD